MSFKLLNTIILFLSLIIVTTATVSSVNSSMKSFKDLILQAALKSMNNYSPNNHTYKNGTLLEAKQISIGENFLIFKVTMLLEHNCIDKSCPREMCQMLINQDKSNNLIVNDQSKACYYGKSKSRTNHANGRFKRSTTDNIMTFILDVSKNHTSDTTEYKISFVLTKQPTCYRTHCSMVEYRTSTVCEITFKDQNSAFQPTDIFSTCDNPDALL